MQVLQENTKWWRANMVGGLSSRNLKDGKSKKLKKKNIQRCLVTYKKVNKVENKLELIYLYK